jgi:hypothetical protein
VQKFPIYFAKCVLRLAEWVCADVILKLPSTHSPPRVCIRKRGAEIDAGKYEFSSSSEQSSQQKAARQCTFQIVFPA